MTTDLSQFHEQSRVIILSQPECFGRAELGVASEICIYRGTSNLARAIEPYSIITTPPYTPFQVLRAFSVSRPGWERVAERPRPLPQAQALRHPQHTPTKTDRL
jgi:hypothetical protein